MTDQTRTPAGTGSGAFVVTDRGPGAEPAVRPAGPRTVLVIDPSRTVRKLVALALAMDGYRVVEAGDATDATDRIRESGVPDLILVDEALPGMDGYEFCNHLRQSPETRRVPVVMWTGRDGLFDKLRGRVAGIDAFLPKPLHPDAVVQAVRSFCPAEPAEAV
jgi:twitching motility two-component system response regulator PilG